MAFEACSNCGSIITCSCEYQVANDGKSCCDNCVAAYNMGLMTKRVVEEVKPQEELIVSEEKIEVENEIESQVDSKKKKNNSL